MDVEINEMKKKQQQQVLQKPNLNRPKSSDASPSQIIDAEPVTKERRPAGGSGFRKKFRPEANSGDPVVQNGQDDKVDVQSKRDKVASVNKQKLKLFRVNSSHKQLCLKLLKPSFEKPPTH